MQLTALPTVKTLIDRNRINTKNLYQPSIRSTYFTGRFKSFKDDLVEENNKNDHLAMQNKYI